MRTDYFAGTTTTDEIKTRYRDLAKQNHPDIIQSRGGDLSAIDIAKVIMQAINAAYAIVMMNGLRREKPDWTEEQYTSAADVNELIRQAIDAVLTLPGIELEICGLWVWVHDSEPSGSYKVHKELKAAGYSFLGGKKQWVYKGVPTSNRGRKFTMDEIRNRYGSQRVEMRRPSQVGGA